MEETNPVQEKRIYRFFEISILLKGANAVLETVGGALVLVISPEFIQNVATYFTAEELGQDPNDFIASHILQWANVYVTGNHQLFVALYLLSHGIVKLVLVVGLLRNRLWAYPAALIVFGLFALYQVYLYTFNHSLAVDALTLFDFVVMYFIWREWYIVREHRQESTHEGEQ